VLVAPHEPDVEQTSSSHMVILRIAVQQVSKGRSQVGRTLILIYSEIEYKLKEYHHYKFI
jgi:hypothetical protein